MDEKEVLQVITIRCKDCQFFRDAGNYQYCIFWSDDDNALTEPEGYCHNALLHDPRNG